MQVASNPVKELKRFLYRFSQSHSTGIKAQQASSEAGRDYFSIPVQSEKPSFGTISAILFHMTTLHLKKTSGDRKARLLLRGP